MGKLVVFPEPPDKMTLCLVGSQVFDSGVVEHVYRPVGR